MNVPNNVFQAVIAMWASLIIWAIVILFEKKLGVINNEYFVFSLVTCAFFSIIPYKIFNRSNASRYIYTVLAVLGLFLMEADGEEPMAKGEMILSIIEIPLEIFILYKLFTRESNLWFSKRT